MEKGLDLAMSSTIRPAFSGFRNFSLGVSWLFHAFMNVTQADVCANDQGGEDTSTHYAAQAGMLEPW